MRSIAKQMQTQLVRYNLPLMLYVCVHVFVFMISIALILFQGAEIVQTMNSDPGIAVSKYIHITRYQHTNN